MKKIKISYSAGNLEQNGARKTPDSIMNMLQIVVTPYMVT